MRRYRVLVATNVPGRPDWHADLCAPDDEAAKLRLAELAGKVHPPAHLGLYAEDTNFPLAVAVGARTLEDL